MAPPVYSRRLALFSYTTANVWTPMYTVPSGHRTILKWVTALCNATPGPSSCYLGIGTFAIHTFDQVATNVMKDWGTWVVLEPGDTLQMFSTVTVWAMTAHGQELSIV